MDQSSQRVHNILEHLEELWQLPHEPSAADLKNITEFVIGLQEPYRTIGLRQIAEHTMSNIHLQILSLMALFQQKAEEEGISLASQYKTFEQINPIAFQVMDDVNKNCSISSFEDLSALCSIAVGLQMLSQSDSAQEAQSWLYELPTTYYQQLEQEKLIIPGTSDIPFKNWTSYVSVTPTPTRIVLLEPGQNTSTCAA
ncbi:MAG: hypothetical protein ABI234_05265 [Ktedonobacteraceae bacterium]